MHENTVSIAARNHLAASVNFVLGEGAGPFTHHLYSDTTPFSPQTAVVEMMRRLDLGLRISYIIGRHVSQNAPVHPSSLTAAVSCTGLSTITAGARSPAVQSSCFLGPVCAKTQVRATTKDFSKLQLVQLRSDYAKGYSLQQVRERLLRKRRNRHLNNKQSFSQVQTYVLTQPGTTIGFHGETQAGESSR